MKRIPTHKLRVWTTRHKVGLIRAGIALFIVLMMTQFFYPASRLPLFASVDGVNLSGWPKDKAAERLNKLSSEHSVVITLGRSDKAHSTVKPSEIGLKISHKERISSSSYPWYLRIIPTSLFWFGPLQAEKPASYVSSKQDAEEFLKTKLGNSCSIPAKDASLKLSGDKLIVVSAANGGVCKQDEAVNVLSKTRPVINTPAKLSIPVEVSSPKVNDTAAEKLANSLNTQTEKGVVLEVADVKQTIDKKDVLSWLSFKSEGDKLIFTIDPTKAGEYLSKTATPKVAKPAGITKVSTLDFTETSRANGAIGQTLGLTPTLASIQSVLEGKDSAAKVAVVGVDPKVEYIRSYTKTSTGIAATLQHYSEDNSGTFGISFVELGGRGLSASYNANRSFITASTYKLFVAYSVLTRVEKNEWKWTDDVAGGRNLSTCFDDMIVKSDNACAEVMYKKVGYQTVINEVRGLGLASTTLAGDGQRTSSGDLATFLTKLENKSIGLNDESRGKLLDAMKRNVYRQGVPAGASGVTANKVGFLNGLLHDAAIVYSPKGTYVLVVMSDGSSWGNIADLTRKIESLR